MLKELVKKFRSRSQSEPTAEQPKSPRRGNTPDGCPLRKANNSRSRDDGIGEMDSDRFNRARLAKILARCEKENIEAQTADEECCICLTQKATVMALPCNHRVTCKKCSVLLVQKAHENNEFMIKCVLCRQEIKKFCLEKGAGRVERTRYEQIVPYDLNIPRALGRRCYSLSTGSPIPINRGKRVPTTPAGSA